MWVDQGLGRRIRSGMWLVAAMVGRYGGCGMGGWIWWPVVLRIVGLRERERIKNNKEIIFK